MAKLLLAPMEGLADAELRDVLTRIGGFDGAVCEFVRVSGNLLPPRAFRRICPELLDGSRTAAGTPVAVQLLGSDSACLAENAAQLVELAPAGIDLNFGCPAPTVNRHGGGAMLLADPERLHSIVERVRRVVPPHIPFSAKMRLGIHDKARALDCARALAAGGVDFMVVHARTRDEGYRPPAHWTWLARIKAVVDVPVVANGEVWTVDDYGRCRATSDCRDVMLGRGVVADPFLARRICLQFSGQALDTDRSSDWHELLPYLGEYWQKVQCKVEARHAPGRLKLWLGALRRTFAEGEALHWALRPLRDCAEVSRLLLAHGVPLAVSATE